MAPSGSLGSRVALAALCAAWAALAAAPAFGQASSPSQGGKGSPRAAKKTTASSALALPTLSSPFPKPGQAQPPSPLTIPAEPVPLMRGSTGEGDVPVSTAANYGAPIKREKLPRPYPPPRAPYPPQFSPKNPLPALEPYKSSYVARQRLRLRATAQPGAPAPLAPPPVTVAVEPTIKTKPKPKVELNPYDPLGVAVGSTLLFPYAQASSGYDDNPNRLAPNYNPRGSTFFRGEGGLKVKSDWARHSLDGELRGAYTEYFDYPAANRPEATGSMNGRYDVTQDTALVLRGRMSLDTQRPGAPAIQPGQSTVYVVNRPVIFGVGAQAGVSQKFGRIGVELRGTYDRVWYTDAQYSNGTTLNLAATSYNDFGVLLRSSYEVTPDLKPFVEGTVDRRIHDSPVDFNGFYRDSTGYIVRGGAEFNVTDMVKGEVSGGYGQRNYEDPSLVPLRGPVIDAALIYTPSALTTFTLRGSTSMNETTLANASGVLTRSVTATLSHDLMRNLNVTITGNYFNNNYQGADVQERGGFAGVTLDYKVTRTISLRGSYRYELLDTTFPNADYTANVYLVGLRFQL
ncbi:outer membrane beta-barrel protein [Methylocystis parvus]|uniref:Outer membrane beta-barrel protein n=1 Tax=Methylocystis parvus TaxID=134 RepID=A0A6B8M6N5_9HYPH|nr:outer membrane beta-barrel protein [Methylocystis parvus]QGM96480.1 outer membrane beta-barrel protein [Methylocystis parvus]WBJ99669.1 outer membrane beta-barrel protein [Methylocystis parvus OBBP]